MSEISNVDIKDLPKVVKKLKKNPTIKKATELKKESQKKTLVYAKGDGQLDKTSRDKIENDIYIKLKGLNKKDAGIILMSLKHRLNIK